MTRRTADKSELLALRTSYMQELIQSSINRRWGNTPWEILYPWWREPSKVRILMYADGEVCFSGGAFGGLQHVKTLLESQVYFYVDFDIKTAHRNGDQSACITTPMKLTDLDILNSFDEIWFFGFKSQPDLTDDEVKLLDEFMAIPGYGAAPKCGGVLVTGDHGDLGKGIAGTIPRAGEMRRYPAAQNEPGRSNTTLREGPDDNSRYNEFDQYDDCAQRIRYMRFPVGTPTAFQGSFRPHPVLCGPDGPIDVLPDHGHEGEAIVPETIASDDPNWPTKNGHQEKPYIIAKGLIRDPDSINRGKEIGLVSVYDGHNVDVGRIVADSSWHHWFDVNLLGVFDTPSPYAGFDATPAGQATLKKIDAYFLNCAAWLAPPDKQAEMRNAAWWSILWTDQIVELSEDAHVWYLGEQAISALGLRASQCAVTEWVLDSPALSELIPRRELPKLHESLSLIDLPFEQYIAGGILQQLMKEVGPCNPDLRFPRDAPPDDILESAIAVGAKKGIEALKEQLSADTSLTLKLIDNNFRLY